MSTFYYPRINTRTHKGGEWVVPAAARWRTSLLGDGDGQAGPHLCHCDQLTEGRPFRAARQKTKWHRASTLLECLGQDCLCHIRIWRGVSWEIHRKEIFMVNISLEEGIAIITGHRAPQAFILTGESPCGMLVHAKLDHPQIPNCPKGHF